MEKLCGISLEVYSASRQSLIRKIEGDSARRVQDVTLSSQKNKTELYNIDFRM